MLKFVTAIAIEASPIVPRTEPITPRFAAPSAATAPPVVPTINRIAGGQVLFRMAGRICPICPDRMLTTVP
jgi:hypothetical protein